MLLWVTYHNRPGGFGVAVAPRFGLLYFMTVDPTSQLMSQPANQYILLSFFPPHFSYDLMRKEKRKPYIKEFIAYSKHLVLFTGGWHGGGGLRKMGSFTTIRALSSELQDRRNASFKSMQEFYNKNLFKNIFQMLGKCFEYKRQPTWLYVLSRRWTQEGFEQQEAKWQQKNTLLVASMW